MNDLQGKRVAILMTDGVEIAEYTRPREFVEQHGATAELLSPKDKGEEIQGFNHIAPGQKFKVDLNVREANPADYDLLILPGGVINADQMRLSQDAISFIREFGETGRPLAVICHGPWELIDAGLVQGRKVTSWPSLQNDLRNAGAEWVDQAVIVDRQLITSRKPDDLPQFTEAILKLLTSQAQPQPQQ